MIQRELAGIPGLPSDVGTILSTDPFFRSLPDIDAVSPISGGVAHHVYRIDRNGSGYFLKIRKDRFAAIPSITCDPQDIDNEFRALTLLGSRIPGIVPEVLSFDPQRHYLVLSDVIRGGMTLTAGLNETQCADPLFFRYGQTLRLIHDRTNDIREPVRPAGDDTYYTRVLGHRFGYRNHPALDRLITRLSVLPDRRFILGDYAPKNIGILPETGQLTLFDLETCHLGNREFDYGYGLAHALLHSAPNRETMEQAVSAYSRGYGEQSFDPGLVTDITRGILLYRLHSIIPYPTRLKAHEAHTMEAAILDQLDSDGTVHDWAALGLY